MVDKGQKVSAGKYTVKVVKQEELKAISRDFGDRALQETMDEHFFEHPLRTVDKAISARIAPESAREERPIVVKPNPDFLLPLPPKRDDR